MARPVLFAACAALMAAPLWADVPPSKGKCSAGEDAGLILAVALIAATIAALRAMRRGIRGRA